MKTILTFLAVLVAVVIVACGDHVTVPADKTGNCAAGLLKKCGDVCVDYKTDIANCGDCGIACSGAKICVDGKCADSCPPGSTRCGDQCVNTDLDRSNCGMCAKKCNANEVCAKGKCGASCEAVGYLTCSGSMAMLDAGGAVDCVDPAVDPNNCGACGNKCMPTDTCSNGLCCGPGQMGCGGQCLDILSNPNNCGGCGVVCPMGTTCAVGTCTKCNNTVLVIADNQTTVNNNMKTVITNAGFVPTVIDNGYTTYTGSPSPNGFGAVMWFPGSQYNSDMPSSGQQALVSAQAAGVGMVIDGFVHYAVAQGHLQTAKTLSLANYGNSNIASQTIAANISQPWFFGLPGSFGMVNYALWFCSVPTSGSQFAQISTGVACPATNSTVWNAGQFRAQPNGRIAQIMYGMSYNGAGNQWAQGTLDANLNGLVINAIRWATSCTN